MTEVFEVVAFIDWGYRIPHYPRYNVSMRTIGSAATLKEAEGIISDALQEEYLLGNYHHFRIVKLSFGVYFGNDNLAVYTYDNKGTPLAKREYPYYDGEFLGQHPEELKFAEGDLCEVMLDGHMCLGIVLNQPPTVARVEEIRTMGGRLDESDDSYEVLCYGEEGDMYDSHFETTGVFPPIHKVNPNLERKLKQIYHDKLTEPIRLSIADTTAEALIKQMLEELHLEARVIRPENQGFPFWLQFDKGQGHSLTGRNVYIQQSVAHQHMDRVRATFLRWAGRKADCRGYSLQPIVENGQENYYIGMRKAYRRRKKTRQRRYKK